MQKRFSILGCVVAALAAMTIASGPALAQISSATKISGTATGTGSVSRTITDIPAEPNGLAIGPLGLAQVLVTTINVPVLGGQSADTIGTHFRDSLNVNLALKAAGYSSVFTTPSGTAKRSRPKMARQVGSFSVSDGSTAPGVTLAPDAYTVEDAPALSPVGLGFLVGALPALAFWRRRRNRKSA